MRNSGFSWLVVISLMALQVPLASLAQAPATKKQTPAPKTAAPVKPAAAAKTPSSEPAVLTNDSIIKMVAAGVDEKTVVAKINSSAAATFRLDADGLTRLKSANVAPAVVRAMLNWKAPGAAPAAAAAAASPAPAEAAPVILVKEPVPAVPAEPPRPAQLDTVIARQGVAFFPLSDKPQAVLFVKSEAGSAKDAIVNVVLSDVGIQLITMGLTPMMPWNPYLGDAISKAAKLGKNLLLNKNGDTKGFEIETLTGSTADVTLKEGPVEFLVPVNRYIPSADMDPSSIEPLVLRMQPRDNEQRRMLSNRKVVLKQTKTGRFDLKPTTDRVESNVEQSLVPITVDRMPEGVIRITTNEDLKRGEYALVFRKKDASGAYTANVPLKPAARQPSAPAEATPAAGFPGMTPEQVQLMQQQQGQAQTPPPRGGMLGLGGLGRRPPAAPPAPPPAAAGSDAGFLAWDFRVLQ